MNVCDEIKIAWAEWVIDGHGEPKQVILPLSKHAALLVHINGTDDAGGFQRSISFRDMVVYKYDGDKIVFS